MDTANYKVVVGGPNQQSILPNFNVFENPPSRTMPLVGRPPKQASAGMGIIPPWLALYSPVAAAAKLTSRQPQGVGQVGGMMAGAVTWIVLLGAGGWLSYQAGKAMAPSGSKKKWGYIGIPVGLLTGHFGLGVMGFMANRKG